MERAALGHLHGRCMQQCARKLHACPSGPSVARSRWQHVMHNCAILNKSNGQSRSQKLAAPQHNARGCQEHWLQTGNEGVIHARAY